MTPLRCEQFLQRTDLLLRMLPGGDLSRQVSPAVADEVRRVLRYEEPPLEPPGDDPLADSDE